MTDKVFEGWQELANRLNSGESKISLTPAESAKFSRALMLDELNEIVTERIDIIIN